jgi:hypothetical protein
MSGFSPIAVRIASIITWSGRLVPLAMSSRASLALSPQVQVSSNASMLASAPCAGGGLEQDVVAGVRIERRIEVDEVHALVGHVIAQDLEIVALVKPVGHGVGSSS